MRSFNPFHGIIETKFSPHARTLRTSFWGKLSDTFRVIFGLVFIPNNSQSRAQFQFGLFDYFTLGIHQGLSLARKKIKTSGLKPTTKSVIDFFIAIPWAILVLPRFVFAAAVTLAVLPLVLGVHLVATLASRRLVKDVRAIMLDKKRNKRVYADQTTMVEKPSATFLHVFKKFPISTFQVGVVEKITATDKNQMCTINGKQYPRIRYRETNELPAAEKFTLQFIKCSSGIDNEFDEKARSATIDPAKDDKQKAGFRALLKLNIHNLTANLESNEKNDLSGYQARIKKRQPRGATRF